MHVEQRHIARRLSHSQQRHWPSIGAIIGAILIGSQIDSTVATGAILGATASQMQQGISMTRQFELEADRLGIELLDHSGFDVYAMPNFFARMQQKHLDYGNSRFKLLRTHPVTHERIADSTNRAKHYQRKARQIHEDYPLIKARLRVLSSNSPEEILSYYEQALSQKTTLEEQYGYALALASMHQPQLAVERLQVLSKQHPKSLALAVSIAEIMTSYAPKEALSYYKNPLPKTRLPAGSRTQFGALIGSNESLSRNHRFTTTSLQSITRKPRVPLAYCTSLWPQAITL